MIFPGLAVMLNLFQHLQNNNYRLDPETSLPAARQVRDENYILFITNQFT